MGGIGVHDVCFLLERGSQAVRHSLCLAVHGAAAAAAAHARDGVEVAVVVVVVVVVVHLKVHKRQAF